MLLNITYTDLVCFGNFRTLLDHLKPSSDKIWAVVERKHRPSMPRICWIASRWQVWQTFRFIVIQVDQMSPAGQLENVRLYNLFGAWIRFLGNTLYTLYILLHILACFFNVLCVHCFVRGSHRFTAIECWLLAKSWEYEYLISFRLSDMFRQIIDGKALADVMETWRMWVTLSLKLVTQKTLKIDCHCRVHRFQENPTWE